MSNSPQENELPNPLQGDTPHWIGFYSGKAFRFRYLCILAGTIIYWFLLFHFRAYFVNTKLMPEYFWTFLIGIPVLFWIKSFISGLISPAKIKEKIHEKKGSSKKVTSKIMSLPKLFALILFTIVFCGIGLYYKDFILNFVMTKFFYYAVIGCLIPAILLLATFCKQIYLKLTIHYELKGTILNQKIGYFIIEEDTTLIQQVKDTKLRYNWIDRHINGHTGTLILFTNDYTDPVQYLRGIEKPDEVKNIIASLMALYANKRGIMRFGEDSAVSGDISDDIDQQN